MKCTFLGFKKVKFTNTDTGEVIEGVKVFFAYPEEKTVGREADGKFIAQNVFEGLGLKNEQLAASVDKIVDIEFNKYGKVCGLELPKEVTTK